jgi:hypothetical protein
MKSLQKKLDKLNNLLIMNYEVEKIYLEALDLAMNDNLKAFFRERAFERNEFIRQLRQETAKFNRIPKEFGVLSDSYREILRNFKDLILSENEEDLFEEIYSLKDLNINMYNDLLEEINLPLSTCKLLIKQRDIIYSHMNAMKSQEEFVV